MSKKTKTTDTLIDGVRYKQIQYTNKNDTWWKNVPQNPEGIIGSGLHIIDKQRQKSHWEKYDGKTEIKEDKEYLVNPPKIRSLKIDFKTHGIFPAPPDNQIGVLRGSDKMMEWVSLEYYKRNKDKYSIILGDENNPTVLKLKGIKS
ncbi:hypothetical protein KAT24_00130 [Candidatus Pacearchaeota archaeon]|nr:hypothetical protein [Candidatus Pacearchaeota archaeon]